MTTRILAGQWRNRPVKVPLGDSVRPTTSRVRQSVLDRLAPILPGAQVLDGFAGSGIIGLECLSRGAAFVFAVENSPDHGRVIDQNLKALDIRSNQYHLWLGTMEKRLALGCPPDGPFQLIYLDAPYGYEGLPTICQKLVADGWIAPHGLMLVETGKRTDLGHPTEPWAYGDTVVQVIRGVGA
jgi:16S rRNA (guanine966-N2)-methyltransferase